MGVEVTWTEIVRERGVKEWNNNLFYFIFIVSFGM